MWKRYAEIVCCATRDVVNNVRIYVTGGAVEDRLTIYNDIDVIIVLSSKPSFEEAAELHAKIIDRAKALGLPITAPIKIHLMGLEDLKRSRMLIEVLCREKVEPLICNKT